MSLFHEEGAAFQSGDSRQWQERGCTMHVRYQERGRIGWGGSVSASIEEGEDLQEMVRPFRLA